MCVCVKLLCSVVCLCGVHTAAMHCIWLWRSAVAPRRLTTKPIQRDVVETRLHTLYIWRNTSTDTMYTVKTVFTAIITSTSHSELELSRHLYPLIKAGLLLVKSAVDGCVQSGVNSCDDITATQIIAVNYAFTSKRSRVKVSLNCLLLLQLPTYTVATTVDTKTAATINSDSNGVVL